MQVPLGILAKNENKGGEMIEIMKHHHEEYVPFVAKETPIFIETLQEAVTFKATEMHSILFGGEQLTAAQARSAKRNIANGDSDSVKLLGLIPVAEDWHTKMSLLSVSI